MPHSDELSVCPGLPACLSAVTDATAQAWLEVEERREFFDARVASLPRVDDSAVVTLRAAHAEAPRPRGDTTAYLALAETLPTHVVADLGTEEALRAGPGVEATTTRLQAARAALDDVEARITALEALRDALPARVAALR